jgi:hypothetical protein
MSLVGIFCATVMLVVLKLLQISNPTLDKIADYLPGVMLRSNADRQEIATNINSDRKQISD